MVDSSPPSDDRSPADPTVARPDPTAAAPPETAPVAPSSASPPRRSRRLRRAAARLPVPRLRLPRLRKPKPGTAPGIEHHDLRKHKPPGPPAAVFVSCIDFCPTQWQSHDVDDLDAFLAQHRPAWSRVRWINVDGLGDLAAVEALARKYELHPLAVEDVLHVPQRPKVEHYPATEQGAPPRLFIVARMIQMLDHHLRSEQVSIFLGRNTVITFQETHGDVWEPIRQRIAKGGSRMRENDASFLVYAMLDAIVDHCFPLLDHYSDRLEALEEQILIDPTEHAAHAIHDVKREMLLLRRQVWPMREMLHALAREHYETLSDNTQTYLRDVYDHAVHIIDILETYREVATGLNETYMTAVSNRMNQVMKVLTVIATIFIPLTFLAGVYGMNMPIPENNWWGSYPIFWLICVALAGGMFYWFRRKRWL